MAVTDAAVSQNDADSVAYTSVQSAVSLCLSKLDCDASFDE